MKNLFYFYASEIAFEWVLAPYPMNRCRSLPTQVDVCQVLVTYAGSTACGYLLPPGHLCEVLLQWLGRDVLATSEAVLYFQSLDSCPCYMIVTALEALPE